MSEEILQAKNNLMKSIQTFLKKFNRISFREMPKVLSQAWDNFFKIQHAQPEDTHEFLRKLIKDLQIISEELAEFINSLSWNRPTFYDDDEHSIQYKEYLENSSNEITPVLPTEEANNSLSMGDEHLSTIPEMKSDEVIKSSVENLVPIPSDDDESLSNEDVPIEKFKIYSNSLFDDEESISTKIDPHYFNVESNLLQYLLNQDTLIDSSPKFDYFLEEFSGKLTHIDPIPSGIEEVDFDIEEEICLVEKLLYDNSFLRPQEELNAEIADTIVEYLSSSPIPVEDRDSQMEDIDLFLHTNDLMPSGIKNDDYDSKGDI
nr:hypothetical protein [Tanacetum cinerariifolium]